MNIENLLKGFLLILRNYQRLLKNLLYFLAYTVLITGSSIVITLPLWYAATKYSKTYTITVILLIAALTGLLVFRQLKQWVMNKQKSGLNLHQIILIPIKKISVFTFSTILLYGIIFMYSRQLLFIAVPFTIIYILVLGYYVFIYRKMNVKNYI